MAIGTTTSSRLCTPQKTQDRDYKTLRYSHACIPTCTSKNKCKLPAKHNIKATHIPVKKTMNMLKPIKDSFSLKVPGIYHIPCEHSKVYVRQTGLNTETRAQKYMTPISWPNQEVSYGRSCYGHRAQHKIHQYKQTR